MAGALEAPVFQREVLALLGGLGGLSAAAEAPFRICVTRGDAPLLHVRLDGMYKAHRHGALDPAGAAAEIALAAEVLGREAASSNLGAPGDHAGVAGPFPKLYRRNSRPELPPSTILRPCDFDPALVVGYVRLLPHGELPVTLPEVARRWPRVDDLHGLALANLDEATVGAELEGVGWGGEMVMGFATTDGLDAARALLPQRLRAAEEWLGGHVLAAIPCRDLLMLLGDADPEFVAEAAEHVRGIFAADAEGLADYLYRLTPDGLVPLT